MCFEIICSNRQFDKIKNFLADLNMRFKINEYFKGKEKIEKNILLNSPDVFFYKKLKKFKAKIEICSVIEIISNIKNQTTFFNYLNKNKYKFKRNDKQFYILNPDIELLEYLEKKKIQFC